MSNIASLVKKIDSLLAVINDQQRAEQQQRVIIRLPLKDNEPCIEYQRGPVYFYLPAQRASEVGL